jgi:chromosome segregation ATPase
MNEDPIIAALLRLETAQGRIEAQQARLDTRLGAIEAQLDTRLSAIEAQLGALREDLNALAVRMNRLEAGHTSLRVDLMARMDRLDNQLTALRDDMSVNFGATEAVKRANDNTREELRSLGDMVSALYRKVHNLETQVRDLTGDP